MSFTIGALAMSERLNPNTDLDYVLSDWLNLSPTSVSLQDISLSAKINSNTPPPPVATVMEKSLEQNASYFYRPILTRDNNAASLPLLRFTPSPTLASMVPSEMTNPNPQDIASYMRPSSTVFSASPLSQTQKFDFKPSPLSEMFSFNQHIASPRNFTSDDSPVIRGSSQEDVSMNNHLNVEDDERLMKDERMRHILRTQSRTLFFDSRSSPSSSQTLMSPAGARESNRPMLLSPCKISVNVSQPRRRSSAVTDGSPSPHRIGYDEEALPLRSLAFRTLSGPDTPSASSASIKLSTKRLPGDDEIVILPRKRRYQEKLESVANTSPLAPVPGSHPRVSSTSASAPPLASTSRARTSVPSSYTRREFPSSVTISPSFPRFYRRFPVSSYFATFDCGLVLLLPSNEQF